MLSCCDEGNPIMFSVFLVVVVVGAALLVLLHSVRKRSAAPHKERGAAAHARLNAADAPWARDDPRWETGMWRHAARQAALARALLRHVNEETPEAARRRAHFEELQRTFAFQHDSVANQREHLTSLLVSLMSTSAKTYADAVAALHTKLLHPVELWRESVLKTRAPVVAAKASDHVGPWLHGHSVVDALSADAEDEELHMASLVSERGQQANAAARTHETSADDSNVDDSHLGTVGLDLQQRVRPISRGHAAYTSGFS